MLLYSSLWNCIFAAHENIYKMLPPSVANEISSICVWFTLPTWFVNKHFFRAFRFRAAFPSTISIFPRVRTKQTAQHHTHNQQLYVYAIYISKNYENWRRPSKNLMKTRRKKKTETAAAVAVTKYSPQRISAEIYDWCNVHSSLFRFLSSSS